MNILIIDDHPLFRAGIATVVESLGEAARLIESNSCEEALDWIAGNAEPDLILLDLSLPGMDGMSGLARLRDAVPAVPVVVLSANEESAKIRRAFAGGAMGYIPKSAGSDVILHALRLVLAGGMYVPANVVTRPATQSRHAQDLESTALTDRQQEVLNLLSQGLSNKEIAARLALAENTVRVHVAAILRLLGVKNRTEAGYQAVSRGLVRH
jgi:DNA-binding NarL/FixJ family response regulator